MAAGQARQAQKLDPRRVAILDRHGRRRWHVCWENNPRIARIDEPGAFQRITNGGGCRPYHLGKEENRWIFNPDFRASPGEIYFSAAEIKFAAAHSPGIVIEPSIKPGASPNKQWGVERWRHFAQLAKRRGLVLTQLGAAPTQPLPGVAYIETPDFRRACAVLGRAKAFVGHEGGLHHAAAALGVRGVVIFGGFTPVELTGYEIHRNLGVNFDGACGMRTACPHCEIEMAKINPEQVLAELEGILQ